MTKKLKLIGIESQKVNFESTERSELQIIFVGLL